MAGPANDTPPCARIYLRRRFGNGGIGYAADGLCAAHQRPCRRWQSATDNGVEPPKSGRTATAVGMSGTPSPVTTTVASPAPVAARSPDAEPLTASAFSAEVPSSQSAR